ncbi:MAG: TorF family putative porin [Kangiellaceae bacterium]|nr:TorF family putative porin [Kangiellaceae bacterium]
MKTTFIKSASTFILLTLSLSISLVSNVVYADTSANIGVVSQYHYRGIQQTSGASTSAGLDYEEGAIGIGAWVADVSDGLEIDIYGSYSVELDSGLSIGIGATTYQYTGDFDSAYNEVNLSAAFESFSLGYSIGQWDGVLGNKSATEADYTILIASYKHKGFVGTIGIYGNDFEGEYFDLKYSTEIGGFDVGVGLLISGNDLDDDESLYFSLSKSFDL